MTISELSDDQLNRWIAEKMEPHPFFDIPPYPEEGQLLTSNDNCWTAINDGTSERVPKGFCADPELILMMMERISSNSAIEIHIPDESSFVFVKRGIRYQVEIDICIDKRRAVFSGTGKTLGRAIAEAWALSRGWKEGE